MRKKIVLVLVLILSVFVFACCESKADLYAYTDESGEAVYELNLYLSKADLARLETAAGNSGVKKQKENPFGPNIAPAWVGDAPWSVEEYIRILTNISDTQGFSYIRTDNTSAEGFRVMIFEKKLSLTGGELENAKITETGWNPFVRTYRAEYPNPFVDFRKLHDAGKSGDAPDTFFGAFYRGGIAEKYTAEELPAFFDAFPVADQNADGFSVNYILETLSRFTVQAPGEVLRDGSYRYYIFPSKFTADSETIVLNFVRPEATGWILLALLLGGLSTGIVFGILAYRKKHPQTPPSAFRRGGNIEVFGSSPLNPFEEYGESKKSGNPYLDPFE